MSTITKYILNTKETQPFRNALDVTLSANFGLELQPSISIDEVEFVDTNGAKNSQTVRTAWANNPVEGIPFSLNISNATNNIDLPFYLDYTKMKLLSDVATLTGLIKDSSIQSYDFRSQGITQRLLESKGILHSTIYQNVPYIVENRKTLLEKIQLLSQGFSMLKTASDEVFKLIAIATDASTLIGSPLAAVNLLATIASLIAQVSALATLLGQIRESFFPPVLYHRGIKPSTFITLATQYMGYSGVEFGTLSEIMQRETWLGSKNNEIGIEDNIATPVSGILNPSNLGYNLFDAKELIKKKYRCREAIIDNVYHLRPEKDPFWVNNSTLIMPNVLVEKAFVDNGTIRPNYEDVNSSTIIEYATDDSDLHTLDDLVDSVDATSTGKIISVTTISPITANDERKVLLRGSKNVSIPYALCVRKDVLDDLLDIFIGTSEALDFLKQIVTEKIEDLTDVLAIANPALADFVLSFGNRSGVLKVENHFFSVPKVVYLEDFLGAPRIPVNFADIIGADALYRDFHSYDSFIEGKRNPANITETAAKFIYEQVRIPFGLNDFANILNNAYFSTESGKTGKFIKVDWNVRGDFAIVDYWIYNNWMKNIEEITN